MSAPASLTAVATIVAPADRTISRLTDLAFGPDGLLYGTTRYDGALIAWDVTAPGAPVEAFRQPHPGAAAAGADPSLAFIGSTLLSGGGQGGDILQRETGSGSVTGRIDAYSAELRDLTPYSLPYDHSVIYAGISGEDGIARILFDGAGDWTASERHSAAGLTERVVALSTAAIGGTDLLFTASAATDSVTAWEIGGDGGLSPRRSLGPDDGLWIAAPTALATIALDGETYLVAAAGGSGSLSVMRLAANGGMTITDHLLDDRTTRFDAVTTLAAIRHGELAYIVAGGADDGLSVLSLLPDGRLIHRASLADDDTIAMAGIAALDLRARETGLDIFVASGSEPGLTRLAFEIGEAGDIVAGRPGGGAVSGTSRADLMQGGGAEDDLRGRAGRDILIDGAGSDRLTGGSGADIFVLDFDETHDVITDFTPGSDRIELGAWPMLRDTAQLTLENAADGVMLRYGPETLLIRKTGSDPLRIADLERGDLVTAHHLPQNLPAGYPAPPRPAPDLPARPLFPPPPDAPRPPDFGVELIGGRADDRLDGTDRGDWLWGQAGADRITGGGGDDLIDGGTGADRLSGGGGDDLIFGGAGRETGWATIAGRGAQADILTGGAGDDRLWGQAGADRLDGGAGDDILTGGGGRDDFVYTGGADLITDFVPGTDKLLVDGDLGALPDPVHRGDGALSFDFGGGDVLTLAELNGREIPADDIAFL